MTTLQCSGRCFQRRCNVAAAAFGGATSEGGDAAMKQTTLLPAMTGAVVVLLRGGTPLRSRIRELQRHGERSSGIH